MKNKWIADLSFCAMLLVFLASMYVTGADEAFRSLNLIRFSVLLAIMMVTYFTSLLTGLIINILVIFGYATYLIISVLSLGGSIDSGAYFFMVACPVMTVAVALPFQKTQQLETERVALIEKLSQTAAFDTRVGLRTRRAFESDLDLYRGLANRYEYEIVLLIWQFRFPAELKRILGERTFERVALGICKFAGSCFPKGDSVYLLSQAPYVWGALRTVKPNETVLDVIDHAKKKLDTSKLNKKRAGKRRVPNIEFRFSAERDDATSTGEAYIARVLANMQYDV